MGFRNEGEKVAYCGLYCPDCIPSDGELFDLVEAVLKKFEAHEFDEYAAYKMETTDVFQHYAACKAFLTFLSTMRCSSPCHSPEGPCCKTSCPPDCAIRVCAVEKQIDGCWQCDEYKACEKLGVMKKPHIFLEGNVDLLANHGLEGHAERRLGHYRWQK